jgi:hypothetical protein
MRKLFNYIKSFFIKSKNIDNTKIITNLDNPADKLLMAILDGNLAQNINDQENENDDDVLAEVTFKLMGSGDVAIDTIWNSHDSIAAKAYAEFLYHINAGHLKQSIQENLLQYAMVHQNSKFVEYICQRWERLDKNNDTRPVVTASNVLKQ